MVIYHRWGAAVDGGPERFIVVLNFSDVAQFVDILFSTNGTWQHLLDDQFDGVANWRLHDQRMESNWGRLCYHNA